MQAQGQLRKMTYDEEKTPVFYYLSLDDKPIAISPHIGKNLTIKFSGNITCIACGRKTKKSYDQGYCFPCARDLPENAMCSVRPETCNHEFGNEADQEFFKTRCNTDHFVYLSQTSGVKFGITHHKNIPSRWIDQGAFKAVIIAKVPQRRLSGEIEVALAKNMSDKTNWRKMLKGEVEEIDLLAIRDKAISEIPEDLQQYALKDEKIRTLSYPVQSVPDKISSHNLDKVPELTAQLTGIKGQYLIFEDRVINLRKYTGYHVEISVD